MLEAELIRKETEKRHAEKAEIERIRDEEREQRANEVLQQQ